ncbi:MAG: family 78 glycoside hydrolase catalytic domain [Lentisphaerae bacterium]|nr:family 78 glycoside hydrolase catalytic domain [Lentisphaerota bacterium]
MKRTWHGYWINGSNGNFHSTSPVWPAPYLRKTFTCATAPKKAVVYLCGLGWHELYVNGRKADDRVLAPVVTQYEQRASYIDYDVTALLRPGKNALVVLLGNGWYNCHTHEVWGFVRAPWRDFPKLLCDVEIDGQVAVQSNASWKTTASPVTFDGLRNGEFYDAAKEIPGFADPDFDDSDWRAAQQCSPPGGLIVREDLEPCKVTRRIEAVGSTTLADGAVVYDFALNMAGHCEITVSGPAGAEVVLQYSERIADNGDIDRRIISKFVKEGVFQEDRYRLKGQDEESWSPRFTYHGFRYVKVILSGGAKLSGIRACMVHNAFAGTGAFACSHEIANRLQAMTQQSFLSNFVGIPTDSPHREKNGWTGDAQLVAETGLWNYDTRRAFAHFVQLLVDTQRRNGQLPGVAPSGGYGFNWGSGPAWDRLLFEYPWRLYLFCGDTATICRHYGAMKLYLDYCQSMSEGNLVRFGLGDWFAFDKKRVAPVELTSSAYYFSNVTIMAEFARILGHGDEATHYQDLASCICRAINAKFHRGDGIYAGGEWTSLGAALYFGLVPESERAKTAAALAEKVRANAHKVNFGILGAKYVPRVLADYGYADDAFKLLTQTEFPGWGYLAKLGETTLWEDWPGEHQRNSVLFGDLSAWFYQYLGGLCPTKEGPGCKHVLIRPCFVRDLDWVKVSYQSTNGTFHSEWRREHGSIRCRFVVPPACTADIVLPGVEARHKVSGEQLVDLSENLAYGP